MFRQFTRSEKPAGSNVVDLGAKTARLTASPAAADPLDQELVMRLELKSHLHDILLDRLNLAVIDKVQPDELRREVAALVAQVLSDENRPMRTEEFKKLVDELLDEVLGFGPLEPLLADPTVNDILVNGPQQIFVERAGKLTLTAVPSGNSSWCHGSRMSALKIWPCSSSTS